ncbi:MAG: cyclic nucleotide-binding domain-containing protein [Bryobacterales bacterium]|nr:cyclic nucleotide-binding domain-containing protein [Bryobacterales bacterium]
MINGQLELFNGLPDDEVARALSLGARVSLRTGAELFAIGTDADRIFIVERGRIKLTLPMQVRGQVEDVLVEEMGPGQTVGWSALIPPFRFTLKATAPVETEVIALSREALREMFADDPAAGYAITLNVAAVIGQRLQLFQTMWLREMQRTVELHCH